MSNERVSYLYQRDPSVDRRFRPRPAKARDLFKEIAEDDEMENIEPNRSATSTLSQNSSETVDTTASVFLRLRPLKVPCKHYQVENNLVKVLPTENLSTNNKDLTEKHFEFSKIFENQASQMGIYNQTMYSSIQNDESLSILTYGTSGSGKTFTMYGEKESEAGLVQRAIVLIFTQNESIICPTPAVKIDKGNFLMVTKENIDLELATSAQFHRSDSVTKHDQMIKNIRSDHKFPGTSSDWDCAFVWISFAEIYNENVYDLLKPQSNTLTKRKNLKVISNDGNSYVKDLSSVHVATIHDTFDVIQSGLQQVNYASTNINAHSSRSHCILMVNVIHFSYPDRYSLSTYKFCDLARSERFKKTENVGDRVKEVQRINTSLLVLGRCFDLMFQNQQSKSKEVVPFRESKLTMLLQKSLLGHEKITTIVTMTPKMDFIEENLQVLNFASIAQQIVYQQPKPKTNVRRDARSTRFSWFMERVQQSSNSDLADLISKNELLEDELFDVKAERDSLLEILQQLNAKHAKKEHELRVKLVEERESQMKTASEKWQKRIEFAEIEELEEENARLRRRLNASSHAEIVELEDESDDDSDNDEELAANSSVGLDETAQVTDSDDVEIPHIGKKRCLNSSHD